MNTFFALLWSVLTQYARTGVGVFVITFAFVAGVYIIAEPIIRERLSRK